ncbi:MAG: hypothetical protein F4Y25_02115 [Chloroflexi bacterium]|nr:hypothetical protein [Chloroflexota bacterium]
MTVVPRDFTIGAVGASGGAGVGVGVGVGNGVGVGVGEAQAARNTTARTTIGNEICLYLASRFFIPC